MKQGFETPDGKRVDVETAFKDPDHPFRVAIVCAMWLTGFDVECLSTLYIDKPMKAHTLMQAIARANRVYPGQGLRPDRGLQRDAQEPARGARAIRARRGRRRRGGNRRADRGARKRVARRRIEATEKHLRGLGFEPNRLTGAKGFARIAALADGAEAVFNRATKEGGASRSWRGRSSSASRRW